MKLNQTCRTAAHLEFIVAADAGLADVTCLADGAVVVIAGDMGLVDAARNVGTCAHVRAHLNGSSQAVTRQHIRPQLTMLPSIPRSYSSKGKTCMSLNTKYAPECSVGTWNN